MTATDPERELAALDRHLMWLGFRQMLPIASFVVVFGAAYGLAAAQAGVGTGWILLLSATVFAGAAQFAVLKLWGDQVPLLAVAVTVFAINARHLLMGASLYPWLRHHPPARRYGAMVLASDANWALAMQALGRGQPGLGVLVGGGLALWVTWVAGTALGSVLGGAIAEPRRFGLDMVMGCFLLALALGGPKSLRTVAIWAVAAVASLAAYRFLPPNSHVVAGALAGGVLGALWMERGDGH